MIASPSLTEIPAPALNRPQARRLRDIHRSAGWPSQDELELELLASGWLRSEVDAAGRTRLHLSAAGLQALQAHRQRERARHEAHDRLVEAVAHHLCRHGRVVWTELALLSAAQQDAAWRGCRPDVFSIRHTSSPLRLEPMVHEIKVRRADLLADLKQPTKREAYLALGARLVYVLGCDARGRPIGDADDVPPPCGVWVWRDGGPELLRPAAPPSAGAPATAPATASATTSPTESAAASIPSLGFATWMSLARAVPWHQQHGWSLEDDQHPL